MYFILLMIAIVLLIIALLLLPIKLKKPIMILSGIVIAVFLFVEGCIISQFKAKGPEKLDFIIVLGAKMKKEGPSKILKMRLDKAYEYLEKNPETKVIVSGGQGQDEPISEAQGMHDYLIVEGIEPERIIKEDKSVNTTQNIRFSAKLLEKEKNSVGIVTNNFHVFRGVKIAQKEGFSQVYGIAAKSDPFLQCNYMTREFFGILKDFLQGNM